MKYYAIKYITCEVVEINIDLFCERIDFFKREGGIKHIDIGNVRIYVTAKYNIPIAATYLKA